MPYYSGQNGELLIDGAKAGRVIDWAINTSLQMLDTTSLADTDTTSTPGVRSTSGSFTLFYYASNPLDKTTNSASFVLNRLIKVATSSDAPGVAAETDPVTLRLRVKDGTDDGKYIQGQAWITSASMAMAVGEVLKASCTFEFIGAPTEMNI